MQCCCIQAMPPESAILLQISKAAMQAIHKQIHCPLGNQTNTHVVLIKAIATILLERAQQGVSTSIIKVKSHIGIAGRDG